MYEFVSGIEKDMNKAIYWYKKSAAQGDHDAQNRLEKLFSKKNKKNDSCMIN